jgi:hypothetical protein
MARVVGIAYGIAAVLAVPYLAYALTSQPPRPARITGMDLASLVIPRPGRTFGISWLTKAAAGPDAISAACYVGIPLLVLAILLAVTSWSSRFVRFLTCMLAFIIVASIGPILRIEGGRDATLPWARLFHAPILRNAYPARLMLFAFLVLAVATALFLAGPARRMVWARWPLAVLVVVFIVLDTVPIKVKFISTQQYRRQLTRGETVVVVSNVGNAGMLWQAESGFYLRLAGGFINAGLSHRTDLPRPVQDLANATPGYVSNFEKYVRRDHVGAILLDANHEPRWVGIFWRMGLHGHRLGDVIVYKTQGCKSCKAVSWTDLGKAKPASA